MDNTLKLSIEEERWIEVNNFEMSGPSDKHFVLGRHKGEIKLGDGKKGIIPPKGSTITIMKYSIANCEEWISKGSPDQFFELKIIPPTPGVTFKLIVEEDEWIEVDDFERSGPSDKHFILDRENRGINFGDGNKGIIPCEGSITKIMKCSIIGYDEWISEGLPDQLFELNKIPPAPGVAFKLIVEEDKWIEVDDFEGSGPSDKHFVLNKEKGKIKLGMD